MAQIAETITIRKLAIKDIDAIMKNFVNDSVLDKVNQQKKAKELTKKDEMKWLKSTIKNYSLKKPSEYNLAIIVSKRVVGAIGTHKIDYDNHNAEIGYWLGEEYWGKGYVTSALKEFIKIIEKKFTLTRLTAYVNENNPASARVLEKNGFFYECTRKKSVRKNKGYINDKQYARVNDG